MSTTKAPLSRAESQQDAHLYELIEFLSYPSISTLSEHKQDVLTTAEWLAEQLRRLDLDRVDLMATPGNPIVYGEWLHAPGKPTVLVYGHYDVQPADPLNEWKSEPFNPEVRDGYVYARGASDMKSQIFAQIKAAECLVREGGMPVNIKYLIEGEEEVGSPNLSGFINAHKELLACDFVLNCDTGIIAPDQPSIVYALRGLAYFELQVRGPGKDLHSGLFGGTVHNPAQALCELIAAMHDEDGRVTLPGFYDKVRELDDAEREDLAKLPFDDDYWKSMTGVPALWGERGYTPVERIGARPTLEVNGIWGGFTGEGSKTVLPAVANAKISMRLVADQQPEDMRSMLEAFLDEHAPDSIEWRLQELSHGPGSIMSRDSKWMQAAVEAFESVYGKKPLFRREGGSIPVVALMQQQLGVDSIMMGFGLPDDGIHGPNERQYVPNFHKGIETYIQFLSSF